MTSPQGIPPEALAALEQGRWIDAIKILRSAQNLDLKSAKESIEALVRQRPELVARLQARRQEFAARARRWMWTLLGLAAAYAAWRAQHGFR